MLARSGVQMATVFQFKCVLERTGEGLKRRKPPDAGRLEDVTYPREDYDSSSFQDVILHGVFRNDRARGGGEKRQSHVCHTVGPSRRKHCLQIKDVVDQ